MKKITLLMLAALVLATGSAHAVRVLDILERSYELALADVTLPAGSTGNLSFKICGACARQFMPLSGSTTYSVSGQLVTYAEMSAAVAQIRADSGVEATTMFMLHYDPDTEVATRIRINTL